MTHKPFCPQQPELKGTLGTWLPCLCAVPAALQAAWPVFLQALRSLQAHASAAPSPPQEAQRPASPASLDTVHAPSGDRVAHDGPAPMVPEPPRPERVKCARPGCKATFVPRRQGAVQRYCTRTCLLADRRARKVAKRPASKALRRVACLAPGCTNTFAPNKRGAPRKYCRERSCTLHQKKDKTPPAEPAPVEAPAEVPAEPTPCARPGCGNPVPLPTGKGGQQRKYCSVPCRTRANWEKCAARTGKPVAPEAPAPPEAPPAPAPAPPAPAPPVDPEERLAVGKDLIDQGKPTSALPVLEAGLLALGAADAVLLAGRQEKKPSGRARLLRDMLETRLRLRVGTDSQPVVVNAKVSEEAASPVRGPLVLLVGGNECLDYAKVVEGELGGRLKHVPKGNVTLPTALRPDAVLVCVGTCSHLLREQAQKVAKAAGLPVQYLSGHTLNDVRKGYMRALGG